MAKALFSLVFIALVVMSAFCAEGAINAHRRQRGGSVKMGAGEMMKFHSVAEELAQLGAIPKVVDWRKKGAVTAVTQTGECAASIAIAAAENIEGLAAVKTGSLVGVSAQELVSCATGCMGSYLSTPYDWLMNHTSGAIATNTSWPYSDSNGKCSHRSEAGAVIRDFYTIDKDESTMAAAVAHRGPIAVLINAEPLELYTKGVASNCSPDQVDQAVTIVGYNLEDKHQYWIIKNSWGPEWGMDGYAYLAYGNNTCGITTLPATAVLNDKFH